jgi:hypothetical protein
LSTASPIVHAACAFGFHRHDFEGREAW